MTRSVEFGGHAFTLHTAGVLWWDATRTLVVSDLHLEKGSHFGLTRNFLPPYDTRETLLKLELLVTELRPQRIILLGDVFHDPKGYSRMEDATRRTLDNLAQQAEVIWVDGNHDKGFAPPLFLSVTEFAEGGLVFRHQAAATEDNVFEISGHYHPVATIRHKGQKVRAACFVKGQRRLLMPAFGAYTGGMDVTDKTVARLFDKDDAMFLLTETQVYAFTLQQAASPVLSGWRI